MSKWTLDVLWDSDGEAFIELPDDAMLAAGFKEGDDIRWIANDDGTWTLKKVEKHDA